MNENKAEFVGFFALTDLLFHHIRYNETSGVVVSEMSVGCMIWCVFFDMYKHGFAKPWGIKPHACI